MSHVIYSIIIPIYNEEEVLTESYTKIKAVMEQADAPYELIFVNDGSRDTSLALLRDLSSSDATLRVISFSRNFGHQNAISAGMDYAKGDAIICIDADLQDPPEVMLQMIEKWKEGYHVVYGKRKSREGDNAFKKATAHVYYRLLRALTTVEIPVDVADFRLIDRQVCDVLNNNIRERNRYIRGLVAWVGYNQTFVEYVRDKRFAGETKYPLKKMIKFATDGITAFSYFPLKIATRIGFLISLVSFFHICFVIFQTLILKNTVDGWASTMSVILFSQGIVLMMLGIIGEYIGRIFQEIKNRPLYVVQETLGYNNLVKEERNI